jgi:hypothetical protein
VAGTTEELSLSVDWEELLKLAKSHMLLPLLCDGLQKAGCWEEVPREARKTLEKAYMQAIYQDAQMEHIRVKLEAELTKANIPYVLLKGAVLKYNYPDPALRTMCDIDILVHTEDYPAIERIALQLQGEAGHSDGNHRNYMFPGGVEVEFHPNLIHQDIPVGTDINPGWQYTEQTPQGVQMTEEGIYLNTLCHLANHFVMGGVGVRFVLDVWVNRHLRENPIDRARVEEELKRFGLLEFAKNIEDLAECWFGKGENTPLLEELGEYIFTSGSHGRTDRAVLNNVTLSKGGSRTSALWGKIFHSRAEMEDRFPWCKGKSILLPIAWCVRAFRAVTKRGKLIFTWSKETSKVTKEQTDAQKEKLARFGIRRKK